MRTGIIRIPFLIFENIKLVKYFDLGGVYEPQNEQNCH